MSDAKLEPTGVQIRMLAFHDYTVGDHDWADYNTDDHTFAGAVEVDRNCGKERLLQAFDDDQLTFQFLNPLDGDSVPQAMYIAYTQTLKAEKYSAVRWRWDELADAEKDAWRNAASIGYTLKFAGKGDQLTPPSAEPVNGDDTCDNPQCFCHN